MALPDLLRKLSESAGPDALREYVVLCILHLLPDAPLLVEALSQVGSRNTFVFGISYSSKPDVLRNLRDQLGTRAACPSPFPFDRELLSFLGDVRDACRTQDKRLIVVQDGGYFLELLRDAGDRGPMQDLLRACRGVVEQTRHGAWLAQELGDLSVPVLDISGCWLKSTHEPIFVVNAVVKNVQYVFDEMTKSGITVPFTIEECGIAVAGFGTIGRELVARLKGMVRDPRRIVAWDRLWVEDSMQARESLNGARSLGVQTANTQDDFDTRASRCQIIVGTTGRQFGIRASLITQIQSTALLVSTSSKQVEIDVGCLEQLCQEPGCRRRVGPPSDSIGAFRWWVEYELADRGSIFVAHEGFPINFAGLSLQVPAMGPVLGLLFEGALHVARNSLSPGVLDGNEALRSEQRDIERYYHG